MNKRHKADVTALRDAEARADTATAELTAARAKEQGRIDRAISRTNSRLAIIDYSILAILLIMGCFGIYDFISGGSLKQYIAWKAVLGIGGAFGLYHLISHIRGSHILGTSNFLNWLGKRLFRTFLSQADVEGFDVDKEVELMGARVRRKSATPTQSAGDFGLH